MNSARMPVFLLCSLLERLLSPTALKTEAVEGSLLAAHLYGSHRRSSQSVHTGPCTRGLLEGSVLNPSLPPKQGKHP